MRRTWQHERLRRRRPRRRLVDVVATGAVGLAVLSACTPSDDGPDPASDAPTEGDPDEADPDDGDHDGDGATGATELASPDDQLEGPAADAADEVPDDWAVLRVEDAQTGPFAIGVPGDVEVWRVGEPLDRLEAALDGSVWWGFWQPRLEVLEPEVANIRAMVVAPTEDGREPVSLQLNVTPYDLDVDPDDAQAIAEVYRTVLEAQGSRIDEAGTAEWDGDEVAEVVHTVPDDVVPAGRDVRQWFYPQPSFGALWSIQCDAPQGADVDDLCTTALGSFRPPR
jgi:hypothetical protein